MVAVLFLLTALPDGIAADGVEPAYRIDDSSADPDKRLEAFDTDTLAVFDLDGDGIREIVAHNDNNRVYVFSGRDGARIAELETNLPSGWNTRELAGISVGDVNGNGKPDLVVVNSAAWVTVFEARPGTGSGGGLGFQRLWENRLDPKEQDPDYYDKRPWLGEHKPPSADGSAYLADVTGDGRDEIFVQLDDMPSLYALDGDGGVRWWRDWSEGNANPVATDLTGDGSIEVLYPSDGGRIFVFDAASGEIHCKFNARDHGPRPGSISVAPTVVDLTGDGAKEMVFGVRNAVEDEDDPEWYHKQSAHYFAVTADCGVLWHRTWDWSHPHVYMNAVPVDVSGNGELDVVFRDWNTVGHKPGDWQVTGKPNLFAVTGGTGELLWREETNEYWSNENLALADVTGDGVQELLVVEPQQGVHGVSLFSLAGERIGFIPVPGEWNVNQGPAVADLDGDGVLEVVVPNMRPSDHCDRDLDVGCRQGSLMVYSTQGTVTPVWPNVKMYNDAYDDEGVRPGARVDVEPEKEPDEEATKEPEEEVEPVDEGDPGESLNDDRGNQSEATSDPEYQDNSEADPEEVGVEGSGEDTLDGSDDGSDDGSNDGSNDGSDDSDVNRTRAEALEEEAPEISFGDPFPGPDGTHDPMDPFIVTVTGSVTVESVTMVLSDQELDVEFDGETAVHTPEEPLPTGDHQLVVTATDQEGRSTTKVVDLSVQGEDTLEADEPVDPEQGDGDQNGEAGEDGRDTPLGPAVVLLAVVSLGSVLALRRSRRR